jgi:hypothetical protein
MVHGTTILDRKAGAKEDLQPIAPEVQPVGADGWQWFLLEVLRANLLETGFPASVFSSGAGSLPDCSRSPD